jgi:cell division protein FtsN
MADRFEDRRYPAADEVAESARAPAGPKAGDPLAELAKLIGQTDPFANFGRANPTHPLRRDAPHRTVDSDQADRRDTDEYFDREIFDEAPSPPAWVQHRNEALAVSDQADDDDLSNRPHPLHRYANQHGADQVEGDAQYADGQHPDPHYGQDSPFQHQAYQDDPYAYADDYADRPDAAREKSRRGLLTVAAVLGLAVIGTGGAFAYRTYVSAPRSGEVPVIKADPTPIKVVPPTTADAANKLIQDRLGTAGTETLVPREEQPVDVRDPTKAGTRPPSGGFASRAPSSGAVPVAPSSGTALPGGEEPRKIRTFTVKGDQTDAANNPPKPPPRAPAPQTASPAPPPARAPAAPGPTAALAPSNAPMSLNPRAPGPPPAVSSGGYVVQVSSQRSEADAQSSYRALQAKFPSVLGSRSANIKRADLGEKGTYYRAVLGPFSSPEDAAALCGNLKSAGGQCVVQRN